MIKVQTLRFKKKHIGTTDAFGLFWIIYSIQCITYVHMIKNYMHMPDMVRVYQYRA